MPHPLIRTSNKKAAAALTSLGKQHRDVDRTTVQEKKHFKLNVKRCREEDSKTAPPTEKFAKLSMNESRKTEEEHLSRLWTQPLLYKHHDDKKTTSTKLPKRVKMECS